MIYLDNNTLQQEVFIPRQNVRNDASPEYATKTELENAIENEVQRADDKYAAKTDLLPYATTGWVESQGFATEEWVEEQIQSAITSETARTEETYQRIDAMSAYSTTNEVEGMITAATDDMATETWVNNQGFLTEHQSLSAYSTTEEMNTAINNATSGKVDTSAMSAYTKTEDFATINGSAITQGGNIEIQGGNYSAGTNIDITYGVISVTGITIPTSNTAFTNDAGYITANDIPTSNTAFTNDAGYITTADTQDFVTSADVETQITDKGYITGYTETDPVFQASAASGITENDIQNWNSKLDSSALTPYYTAVQTETAIDNAVSGKVDTSRVDEIEEVTASALTELKTTKLDSTALTQYYTSAQTDTAIDNAVSGKMDTSAMSAYTPTSGFSTINGSAITSGDNIEIEGTAYSAGTNINIDDNNVISVTGITVPTKLSDLENDEGFITTADTQDFVTSADVKTQIEGYNYVNSGDVETQITNKGYITGYTETDPVFQSSPASGISAQDILDWDAKLDSSALTPYYTSAQTDTAISNATSGLQETLVSGTNIKTINNESILGSGNIVISGGTAYQAGDNIQIQNNIISVTGITSYTGITSGDVTTALGFTPISSTDFESSDRAVSEAINDLNSKKVASNDVRDIVKMTQVQYDAISGSASPTTLYIITD